MPITTAAVSVDDDPAVKIADGGPLRTVIVYNEGTDTVYLGGADVTATTGIPLAAESKIAWTTEQRSDDLYAICDTSETATVRVLSTGS